MLPYGVVFSQKVWYNAFSMIKMGVITLKLTSDNETLAENKVLILYLLNKVGKPISNDSLLNLVLAVKDMNYFYFQQFLLDLLENGYIMNYYKDDHSFYEITRVWKGNFTINTRYSSRHYKVKSR